MTRTTPAPSHSDTSRSRSARPWPWVRLAVSVAVVGVFVLRADASAVARAWADANVALIAAAVALQLGGVALSTAKWRAIARDAEGASFGWFLRTYLVGQFANNFLPSTVGGDAWRVVRLGRRGAGMVHASATVLVERLTGFLALLLLANTGLVLAAIDGGGLGPSWIRWTMVAANVVALLAVVVAVAPGSEHVAARLPWVARTPVPRVAAAIREVRPRGARLALVLVMSLVFQLSWVAVHALCGWAVDVRPPLYLFLLLATMTDLLALVPVSFNGLGVREFTFTVYLSRVDVEAGTAIAFAFVVFTVRTVVSALGGLVLVTERRRG